MKLVVLLVVALSVALATGCGSQATPAPDGGQYPKCPQHRVEGFECMGDAGGVLRKGALICAACQGVDMTGNPTPQPIGCLTVAGGDLCVVTCGECS